MEFKFYKLNEFPLNMSKILNWHINTYHDNEVFIIHKLRMNTSDIYIELCDYIFI